MNAAPASSSARLLYKRRAFNLVGVPALSPTTFSSPKIKQRLNAQTKRAAALIVVSQMLGWGTTYHLPIVLGRTLSADLKLPLEVIFGGLSIMLLISAFMSPRVGVLIDRLGPGRFLIAGSLFASVGLTSLAFAQGVGLYYFAWTLFGFCLAAMLGNAALVALARVAGAQSRRAITTMLLFTAANPFVFYPITGYLSETLGWRTMCLIYAGAHFAIGLPLHLLIASLKPAVATEADLEPSAQERFGALPQQHRRGAMLLILVAFAGHGLIGWGLSPHMINVLTGLGVPAASAIFLASLHGPSQIAGRLVDYGTGGQLPPIRMGIVASILAPIGLLTLIYSADAMALAVVGIGIYGMSAGLNTIVRATAPLHLFGREAYGATLGRIALPMNIACAIAPILFAALISRVGPANSLVVGAGIGLVVLAAMITLGQRTRAALSQVGAGAEARRAS